MGGVTTSDGGWIEAQQRIDGAPSVLYDAVVLLISERSAKALCENAAAVDFVSDAYAHCKYIGFVAGAEALMRHCNVPLDGVGIVTLKDASDIRAFLSQCAALRVWSREEKTFAEPTAALTGAARARKGAINRRKRR